MHVAFLGSLRPDKGIVDVPKVLSYLSEETRSQLVLTFAGKGRLPGSVVSQLEALNIRWILRGGPDFASEPQIADVLSSARALLAPYRGVTTSGSVISALSAGCPVATFDIGGFSCLINPSMLARPGDFATLARILEHLIRMGDRVPDGWFTDWASASRDEWLTSISDLLQMGTPRDPKSCSPSTR
jgi:glycosyltransferase involved in cell wall biosynthesis